MDVPTTDISSILRAKFCDFEARTSRLWADDANDVVVVDVEDEEGASPDGREVASPTPPTPKSFSYLLHFFRIVLLVYHSVTWGKVLRTTGVSFEEPELC